MKKKWIALLLVVLVAFGVTACSGGSKGGDARQEPEKEEVKLVTNGRLSAIEAPEGWVQGETSSDDQLAYETEYQEDGEDPYTVRLWIDISDFDTPESMLENAEENAKDWGTTYTVEDKTIGDVAFFCFIPDFGYKSMYGTKNGVTVIVSHDSEINIDDEAVQNIIKSIEVEPEE